MTTKVFKGSLWTLIGQMIPIGAAFFATPFVLRFLDAEAYGVYILVLLIPTYVNFADFGMSMASTKFGSEAYALGSPEKEARIVRTAALIALATSLPFAAAILFLSGRLIVLFNVPEPLQAEASLALKFAAIAFVLNFLNNIFNTPQLTRLRMGSNILVVSGFRILGIIAVPIVLYSGGGILGAVLVALAVSILTLVAHIFVSGKLLNELFRLSIERAAVRPLLKFGVSLVIAGVAAVFLANLEKLVLTRATSVETLAYYSVAATFASMITLFSGSMAQSMMPAFSQLQGPENRGALDNLYSRSIRITLIWIVPAIVFLALAAKPFFTVWAGEGFGRESTVPFYIILSGLAFNVLAYFPWVAIMAAGRSDIFAKLYWFELFPYILFVFWLAANFGAEGAAAAWAIRIIVDAVLLFWLAKKVGGVSITHHSVRSFIGAAVIMLIPFAAILYFGELNLTVAFITLVCTALYALIVWKMVVEREEIRWFMDKVNAFLER